MKTLLILALILTSFPIAYSLFGEEQRSNAVKPTSAQRRILRGEMTEVEGILNVTGSQASFSKHQNHGPITFYDVPFTDGTFSIEWNHELAQTVTCVFDTEIDGKREHVMKLRFESETLWCISYSGGKAQITKHPFVTKPNVWHNTQVQFKGQTVSVIIDGQTFEYTAPTLSQRKITSGITHGWGTLSIKNTLITPAS
jgi:hypothetical protein